MDAEKFLKVSQCDTFKNFSGFYNSAKRCSVRYNHEAAIKYSTQSSV